MTSAGALDADAWVQSVHKTLMGLTGSAVLHLADLADERRAWTLLRRDVVAIVPADAVHR